MSFKDILVHIDRSQNCPARLALATRVALTLGTVAKDVLAHMTIPVLMSHRNEGIVGKQRQYPPREKI